MSKSDADQRGCIALLDEEDVIRKKVMSAITDSDNKIYFDEEHKPGISNLMVIYGSLCNMTMDEVEAKFMDSNYGTFKKEVADVVINTLIPIQERYNKIINSSLIDEVLDEGIKKVLPMAKQKCLEVQEQVGLGRIRN
jgi:tryptophanyl-tRNA synthetase